MSCSSFSYSNTRGVTAKNQALQEEHSIKYKQMKKFVFKYKN
jgi:hypothetical protein